MPATATGSSLITEIEQFLQEQATSSPLAPNEIGIQEGIQDAFVQDAAGSYSVGRTAGEQLEIRAAAGNLRITNAVAMNTANVATFQALTVTRQILFAVLSRLPSVIGRGGLRIVNMMDGALRNVGSAVAHSIGGTAQLYMDANVRATGWAARQSGFAQQLLADAGLTKPINYHGIGPMNANEVILAQEKAIDWLINRVHQLSLSIGIKEHSTAVPPQVWNQIHNLQAQQAAQVRAMTHLNDRLNAQGADIASLQHQLPNLASQIHGLRQVSAGWQDIKHELDRLGTTVTARQNAQAVQLGSLNSTLSFLSPLALLLQPGIKGLRTLRQVEDTPCMCPKINLPRPTHGDALAYYEFLTHG